MGSVEVYQIRNTLTTVEVLTHPVPIVILPIVILPIVILAPWSSFSASAPAPVLVVPSRGCPYPSASMYYQLQPSN